MVENLVGRRFGRWVVIEQSQNRKGRARWVCRCDCGNSGIVFGSNLKRGTSMSCGCFQRENMSKLKMKHGGWANRDPLYHVWHGIRQRCMCETDSHFPDYGQRGIKMSGAWRNFEAFRAWAIANGYRKGLSIDRIDVNGDYCPENCRWATPLQQQNNRRSCLYYTHNGETHTLKEWARILDLNYSTLYSRVTRYGMTFHEAISKLKHH